MQMTDGMFDAYFSAQQNGHQGSQICTHNLSESGSVDQAESCDLLKQQVSIRPDMQGIERSREGSPYVMVDDTPKAFSAATHLTHSMHSI